MSGQKHTHVGNLKVSQRELSQMSSQNKETEVQRAHKPGAALPSFMQNAAGLVQHAAAS